MDLSARNDLWCVLLPVQWLLIAADRCESRHARLSRDGSTRDRIGLTMLHCKNIRISTDISWQVFRILTEPVFGRLGPIRL